MLRLCQHLPCDDLWIGTIVGDYEQLAWPCRRVDADDARYLELCLGHIRVTGADDSVDSRNVLGAIRHGGDCTRTADCEHAIHAGERGGCQHHTGRIARFARRWRAQDDFAHAGDARGNRTHEH